MFSQFYLWGKNLSFNHICLGRHDKSSPITLFKTL